MCSLRKGFLNSVKVERFGTSLKETESIPPSMHSSSQKYFKLCFSMGSPTKSPHIRAVCKTSFAEASFNPCSLTLDLKKSIKDSSGGIEALFVSLYLKASDTIPHIIPEDFLAVSASRRRPDSS